MNPEPKPAPAPVLTLSEIDRVALERLLSNYGLVLVDLPPGAAIPGSFWGDAEAGLVGSGLYGRPDTPVHSLLHEACHYICMAPSRRRGLHTDAGGDYAEENGVCYLQILLAEALPGVGAARLMADMDRWGYSFRLGSTRAWFEADAEDALAWLHDFALLDPAGHPNGRVRMRE